MIWLWFRTNRKNNMKITNFSLSLSSSSFDVTVALPFMWFWYHFQMHEIWNTLVGLLKVPTHMHKHINTHYWMKIAATAAATTQCFACRRTQDEVIRLKNERLTENAAVSEEGRGCVAYIELNEGIMKQRITDTQLRWYLIGFELLVQSMYVDI